MSEDRGAGGVMVAFMLGAIAGAAVALLVAPASGEKRGATVRKSLESRDKPAKRPDRARVPAQPGMAEHGVERARSVRAGPGAEGAA